MCGVLGYVGGRPAKEHLLDGLARLEHRGYDSAGICLLNGNGLELVKAVGRLGDLRRRAQTLQSDALMGIGHTRWATHGRVTERNAHPLIAGDEVAIVLNGIIENHAELRRSLIAEGHAFSSDTDAEVVAHLLRRHFAGDLLEAARRTDAELEGHFAFVALHAEQPGTLVGARRRCPLLVGIGDGETYLASSIAAFAETTHRVKLLEDHEIVSIDASQATVIGADGEVIVREEVVVPWVDDVVSTGAYETFMLKEIHEQPGAIAATVRATLQRTLDLAAVERIVIVACGTAYHAGLVARYAIEAWAGVPCEVDVASEWRYRDPLLAEHTLVIAISQSGETADTLAGVRLARARGARTLAITNTPGSQITREADDVLLTRAGLEVGVAATKTFTAQLALLYVLAVRLAEQRGRLDAEHAEELRRELRELPLKVVSWLDDPGPVAEIAARCQDEPFFLYLGRHAGVPIALEGALKLKEISYVPADAYPAGEMKHGPIALLSEGTPVVCVATGSHVEDKLRSNLAEVRARGAHVIAVATAGGTALDDLADDVLLVPATHPLLQPVLAVLPLQLLAYHVARGRALDVDHPRNLAKTVTVE